MSTKVLVIPEDPMHNGYILKPVVERVLAEAGRAQAQVTVLPRSKLNGITNAKEAIKNELLKVWKWMDLWIFTPDADQTSSESLRALEQEIARHGVTLFGCAAVPEVEAWLLAGHRDKITVPWQNVAEQTRFKEDVFAPFIEKHGFPNLPGRGREKLTRATLNNYPDLKNCCPEIATLEDRIRKHFAGAV